MGLYLSVFGKVLNLILALGITVLFQVGAGLGLFRLFQKKQWLTEDKLLVTLPIAMGLVGYLCFWAYFASSFLGKAVSLLFFLVALKNFPVLIKSKEPVFKRLRLILTLAVGTVIFYQSLILIRDPHDSGLSASIYVTGGKLPHDSTIPLLIADGLFWGTDPRNVGSTWRSGDRPPLQTGLWLLEAFPFYTSRLSDLGYQVSSSFFQVLWVLSLFSLCFYSGRKKSFKVAFLFCLFSGFFFVHSIYVWPKLLAANFGMSALILLLYFPNEMKNWCLAGVALGLSLLAHSGSAFTYMALLPYWFLFRVRGSVKATVSLLIPIAMLMFPWSMYQKYYDPPGNRLAKLHLAGVEEQDGRSTLQALVDSYSSIKAEVFFEARWKNFTRFWDTLTWEDWRTFNTTRLREGIFFSLFYALGFLCLGILLSLFHKGTSTESVLLGIAFLSLVVWNVLMFLPGNTVIHQGAYLTFFLLFFVGVIGLMEAMKEKVFILIGLQFLSFLAIWFAPLFLERKPGGELWMAVTIISSVVILRGLKRLESVSSTL